MDTAMPELDEEYIDDEDFSDYSDDESKTMAEDHDEPLPDWATDGTTPWNTSSRLLRQGGAKMMGRQTSQVCSPCHGYPDHVFIDDGTVRREEEEVHREGHDHRR